MRLFFQHHKLAVLIVTLVAVTSGALLWFQQRNDISYVHPHRGSIVEAIYGLGKVKTDRIYDVKIAVVKVVDWVYVKEGELVRKGQPLIRLEGDLLFSAPFDGTVTLVAVSEAQSVFPQQTVLRLQDLSNKYIEVSLEQQGALRVQPGQAVRILFENIRNEQLMGTVTSLFPRNEEFLAYIHADALSDNVLPGMTADVSIEVGRKENALLIPLAAIQDGRVTLMREGRRKVVPLKIGGIDGNWAEVLEGDVVEQDEILVKKAR